MESRRERLTKAAARRGGRDPLPVGERLSTDRERETSRRFFALAAGALFLAAVAFVCGVRMGKALTELQWAEGEKALLQDPRGGNPPFRVAGKERVPRAAPEAGKETPAPERGEKSPGEKEADSGKEPSPVGPETAKRPPAQAKYTLQVGAFNNPQEAQDLVNQMKKKGYDAYQVTGSAAAKGTLHRVRIGYFQTLQEARQFAVAFEKKENLKPIISNLTNP